MFSLFQTQTPVSFPQTSAQECSRNTEDMAWLHSKGTFQTNGEGKPEPGMAIDILIML